MQKLIPQNIEAEENFLGCVLIDNKYLQDTILTSADFYLEKHQNIFKGIKWLFNKDKNVDIITLISWLEDKKLLKEIGGRSYLTNLISSCGIHFKQYEQIIKEKSTLRKIGEMGLRISDLSFQESDDVQEVMSKTRDMLDRINFIQKENDDIMPLHEIAKIKQKENPNEYYSTGFQIFDQALNDGFDETKGGFKDGDLIIVSGQTSHGKTSFCQNLSYNIAQNAIPSLWFSYEVSVYKLWRKFQNMGVEKEWIVYSPFKNTTGDVEWIEQKIKEAKEKYWIKVVVIDHLGFLLPKLKQSDMGKNYPAFLTQICRELKTLAMKEEIIIILPVHMRKTSNPTINDLKDSVGPGQEADAVFILNREQNPNEEYGNTYTNYTKIILAKNRDGSETPRAWFEMKNNKFIHDPYYKGIKLKSQKIQF